ncbi:MAG: SDR family oxidoreductase [Kiritimatiellae bacterium]|nr:SDR family oxidoreductase [Kiritimatiellia bacterium]
MEESERSMAGHVLITGCSSGIGRAAAEELIRHNWQVFGTLRKEDDARRVEKELGTRFVPVLLDVTDQKTLDAAVRKVELLLDGQPLSGLVNNAGIAVIGPLLYLPPEALRYQLEVNVVGLVRVTQAFFPLLRADRGGHRGRVVNISSVSGRFVVPFAGAYAASKHAVEALSDAFRREFMPHGVDVVVIEPGRVRTPIWEKVAMSAPGAGTEYDAILSGLGEMLRQRMRGALPPEAVARVVRLALTSPKPRTRYVIPNGWLFGWIIPRLLPDRLLDRVLARQFGLNRR